MAVKVECMDSRIRIMLCPRNLMSILLPLQTLVGLDSHLCTAGIVPIVEQWAITVVLAPLSLLKPSNMRVVVAHLAACPMFSVAPLRDTLGRVH